jgi:hypothetical protein
MSQQLAVVISVVAAASTAIPAQDTRQPHTQLEHDKKTAHLVC